LGFYVAVQMICRF